MDIVAILTLGARIVSLILQVGGDVSVALDVLKKMQAWGSGSTQPTQADFDALDAMVAPYLAMLNDASKDTAP